MQTRAIDTAVNETYITVDEMSDYLCKNYLTNDPLRTQWEAMSTEDQMVYLRRSYRIIDSLPYIGRPANARQESAFPRAGEFTPGDLLKVKYAQAEQALTLSDSVAAKEIEDRKFLRRAGVVHYSIGDLSETFQGAASSTSCGNLYGLSENAYSYLSKWLQGGYKICTSIKKPYGRL